MDLIEKMDTLDVDDRPFKGDYEKIAKEGDLNDIKNALIEIQRGCILNAATLVSENVKNDWRD